MIQPAREDLLIYQGSTYDKRWTWKSNGVPVDLSSAQIKAQARPAAQAGLKYLDMTTENGQILIYDATAGTFGIYLSAEQTAALNFNNAVYDLEIHWASGLVQRLIGGEIALSREVTR
ncbi:hypothetical protein [Marinobacter adhaerens]|uniref:hypothetical protein n=1 Tax=Marinobacter adhaerens TaxID=1033846 RepID=UPI003D2C4B6B